VNEPIGAVYHRHFVADRGDDRVRLDRVVQRHLAGGDRAARAQVQRWIESGSISVNGAPVRRASARTICGDSVVVALPAPASHSATAEEAAVDVLFEDDFLLVVNKPAGQVVHPTYGHAQGTMLNALLWRAQTWPVATRPSFVGRLDRLTSGLLVVAKTAAIHAALQRDLASPSSQKDYLAIVQGRVNVARGRIDFRLRRDSHDRRRVVASPTIGLDSLTRFERLARSRRRQAGVSLLRCRLVTGRMHQIRVHLAARGWPIVGDPLYAGAAPPRIADPDLGARLRAFPRQALHAWRTAFRHPVTGQRLQIEAPLPPDMAELMRACQLEVKAQ
jgi:23S rRNA pseudouridine1911/1915/1917 synthase